MMEGPPHGPSTLLAAGALCLAGSHRRGCLMDNHFHLVVRVPHRPEGFDVSLEVVVARLNRALGEESAKLMHRNLEYWRMTKNEAAIEEWRQQQVARMFWQHGLAMHLGFAA